jgi:hypothetical protein
MLLVFLVHKIIITLVSKARTQSGRCKVLSSTMCQFFGSDIFLGSP